MLKFFVLFSLFFSSINAVHPGPVVIASKGEVWPKPQIEKKTDDYYIIKPHTFTFLSPKNVGCPGLLDQALQRYWTLIAITGSLNNENKDVKADNNFAGYLDSFNISLTGECPGDDTIPAFGDAENYNLTVSNTAGNVLIAPTIWGIFRGLETLSQLVYKVDGELRINSTVIEDYPRFPHRGLLVDTSRHYIPVSILLELLDAMSYNKFNVFHWHITDDHSFPFQSTIYPELSERGAYHPYSKIYTPEVVQRVIEYARLRGIRVVPEFDTPGHTSSWGSSHPELLTTCYKNNLPTGEYGPINPAASSIYDFLKNFFAEVVNTFPDQYFHLGGDEVDFDCWKSNPTITEFMSTMNLTTYPQVESYFIQKVVDILDKLNSKHIVWEEVFVNGVTLPNTTVVQVWRGNGLATLNSVTKAGKFGIYSSCWYLDHLANGGDWQNFYKCKPLDFSGTDEQKKLVIGGEACMWTEAVNEYNIVPRIWPRASAAAERLWSAADVTDISDAEKRLEEHTCRMNTRGIRAQPPNGPGVCL